MFTTMASYQAGGTYSAVVKFFSSKVCFINVPDCWLSESTEIQVFKLFYGDKKEAFVSCLQYKPMSTFKEPHILVNTKYAEMLGLKEWEKVCLQQWNKTIPVIEWIRLEPLTPDDWEILELNAKSIEQNLMNQIRVVWSNQVFPVWVSNLSLRVRIAEINPDSKPALLAEFTELHIVPVERSSQEAPSPLPTFHERKPVYHLQFQHLRTKKLKASFPLKEEDSKIFDTVDSPSHGKPNLSTVARAFSLFSSFLQSSPDEQKLSFLDSVYKDFMPMDIDLILNVLPYSRPHGRPLPLAVQSTTVFISASTYVALYGDTEVPPCFVAVMSKFPPQVTKPVNPPAEMDSQLGVKGKDKKIKSPVIEEERQSTFDSVCVAVMVMQSAEEDEFNLPVGLFYQDNAIVVSRELKRSLSLEVSSRVHLSGIKSKPSIFNTVLLHPISNLPPDTSSDIIRSNFEKWAFGVNGQDSSLVLSDGTLINMRLSGQKYDFFVSLKDHLNQTFNSSSSSLNSTSPNASSLSEQNKHLKSDPKYGFLNYVNMKDLQIKLGPLMALSVLSDLPYLQKPQNLYQEVQSVHLNSLGGIEDSADKALECLEFWLKLRPLSYVASHPFTFSGCMLVCGPKGVGKSVFANGLCKVLAKSPHHVFVQVVHCLPLKGKRLDTIAKKWNEILFDAVSSQPSIILFDDFDYIASAPISHEQEVGPDAVYISGIVETFIHMMMKITESKSKVAVIVTAQSTHTLHSALVNTKGRHIFQKVIEIHPPNVEQRKDILSSLVSSKSHINSKSVENIDWKKISAKTEGYVALDLDALVDRATHAAWVRMGNLPKTQDIVLNIEDFEMALEGYVPSSLRGIPLQVHDHKTWGDVGGLKEVKKVVQQIIMWPIKYKQIFQSYSLKPQTNILFYGAPGTGKTLLAGVIANECGLNFISIKGPELLSKYIGASEQSIRDLFKRASAARPCILFFDEFDSIAPRRGHDSTGVTDRVVNQLLTQLDGVESLEGVHVIAASSRPELIDPALLRPGRLDKCLLCPLPNEVERFDILKCLSSKLSVSPEIDFKDIASKTEHYSGADLQALLYSANIEAFHEVHSQSSRRYSSSSDDLNYPSASDKLMYMPSVEDGLKVPSYEDGKRIVQEVEVVKDNFTGIEKRRSRHRSRLNVVVNQNHLLKVLQNMKPSVSQQERVRYEAVFKNFQGILKGETAVPSRDDMKRVTLA